MSEEAHLGESCYEPLLLSVALEPAVLVSPRSSLEIQSLRHRPSLQNLHYNKILRFSCGHCNSLRSDDLNVREIWQKALI